VGPVDLPADLAALIGGKAGGDGSWAPYDESRLHAATVEAVRVLVEHFGGHDPIVKTGSEGCYATLTRPGKRAADGTSATVGYLAPGVVKIWSADWAGFTAGQVLDLGGLRHKAGLSNGKVRMPGDDLSPFTATGIVRSQMQTWLWKDRLPAGQFTVAAGQEKLGKSTALMWVAARLTRGELEGDLYGTPVDVAFVSAEDDNEHILKPRAVAAGADVNRLFLLDSRGPGFSFTALRDLHPTLVIVDPLSAFIRLGNGNEHGEVAVRQALEEWNSLAQDDGITVVGVRHVRKSPPGDNPYDAVLGSRAWSAAARAVLFFTPDPEHPDEPGGLIFPRGNLARPGGGSRYRLCSTPVLLDDGNMADVPVFALDSGAISITLEEALGPKDEATGRTEAERFLLNVLAGGAEHLKTEVIADAEALGIAERTVQRARSKLGVVVRQEGFGKDRRSWWRLPAQGKP